MEDGQSRPHQWWGVGSKLSCYIGTAIKSLKGRDILYSLFRKKFVFCLITGSNQSWWIQQQILYDNLEVNDMRPKVQLLCFYPAPSQSVRPSDHNLKQEQLQTLYLFCQRTHRHLTQTQHKGPADGGKNPNMPIWRWSEGNENIFSTCKRLFRRIRHRWCFLILQQPKAWQVPGTSCVHHISPGYLIVSVSQLRLHAICYKLVNI